MTASEPYKRWWSVAYVDLIDHREFRLTAQLVPAQWSNVFGKNGAVARNEFERCVKELIKLALRSVVCLPLMASTSLVGPLALYCGHTLLPAISDIPTGNFSWAGLRDPAQLWLQSRTRKDIRAYFDDLLVAGQDGQDRPPRSDLLPCAVTPMIDANFSITCFKNKWK